MSQLQNVRFSTQPKPTLTNGSYQEQSWHFAPRRPLRAGVTRNASPFLNFCYNGSREKINKTGATDGQPLSFAAKRDSQVHAASSIHTDQLKVTTPSNVGRRRKHVASIIASPPRASHSVKISKIFQDAHANLVNASRKGLGVQSSASPVLSTSKHRRTFGGQHPPPTLCRESTEITTLSTCDMGVDQPPQFSNTPRPFSELAFSPASSRKAQLTMAQSKPVMEHETNFTPASTPIQHHHTSAMYSTVVKGKTEGDSPQLPALQPLGDLFDDVAALLGPPAPETPPYDMSTEYPISSPPPRPSRSQEVALYSPTGTWSDDHSFYPGPSRPVDIPQSPSSQAWTDDSKFYPGPSGNIFPPSPPINLPPPKLRMKAPPTEEAVLTWLDKVNPSAPTGLLAPQPMQGCEFHQHVPNSNTNTEDQDTATAEDVTSSNKSSPASHCTHGTPSPKLRRSNSTCSSPPRVTSGSQSPPLSPLSPDVEIQRGNRKRERSRTASYYDEDILKVQEAIRKKEQRRKARLQKYGCGADE